MNAANVQQQILVAVDDFTDNQFDRICNAVQGWALVRRIPQSTPSEQYRAELERAQIVVGWPDPRLLPGTSVRLVQIGSSGWDAYEGSELRDSGIAICSGRGIYSIGVAEHCIAMMLALARRLPLHIHDMQQKVFRRHPGYAEIAGTTACIVGPGNIGMELASRCNGLGMRVIAVARDESKISPLMEKMFPVRDLKLAVRQSDHIFLTASGNRENQKLFTREVLDAFRHTAYFYNVSRGTNVDQAALCELLAQGRIAGAGLDVTLVEPLPEDSPLWNLGDNVLITGHSAGLSQGHPERFCALVIRNLCRFRDGETLENQVL
jgi:phosphoglycerate dehydrogenase-like enzyme